MARDCTRAVLHLSCDERWVAGVGGAIAYFAERAGLQEEVRDSLVAGLERLCRQTLPSLEHRQETLRVAIADFADRIETVGKNGYRFNS